MSDLSRKVFLAEVAAVNEHLAEQQPTTDHTPPTDQTADQTALRDRIAAALYEHSHPGWAISFPDLDQDQRDTYLARADAVLAVLPATADQAAVPLSETERKMLEYALDLADEEIATDGSDFTDDEEDALAELRRIVTKPIATGTVELRGDTEIRAATLREAATRYEEILAKANTGQDPRYWTAVRDITLGLRRMADETQPAEHRPAVSRWRVETLDNLAGEWAPGTGWPVRDLAVERFEVMNAKAPTWKDGTPVTRRLVRETTTYTVEAEHQPAAGVRQDGAQP